MNFIDIYGIEHKNCRVVLAENDYKRIFIFEDSIGHRFMGMKDKPDKIKGYHSNKHWSRPNIWEAPKSYLDSIN